MKCGVYVILTLLIPNYVLAIEVGKCGHYFKSYYSIFRNNSFFDSERNRVLFGFDGKGRFMTVVVDYRYGISDRLNVGLILPWVSNRFENDFNLFQRERISDLTLLGEYRFLDFSKVRKVLSLRAGLITSTGYKTDHPIWLGNGTTEALAGLIFKQFWKGKGQKIDSSRIDSLRAWYEIDVAVRIPVDQDDGNIDGDWSVPIHIGFNYRPIYKLTFGSGFVASVNDRRDFLGVEALIKYRLSFPVEFEIGLTHMIAGRNSSAGTAILAGLLINTGRIWN